MSKPNNTNSPAGNAPQTPQANNSGGTHGAKPTTTPPKNNVITLPGMCMAEECKKRSEKANFCMEHFDWFKEGLITKEGRRPSDFEKKHSDYSRKKKSA